MKTIYWTFLLVSFLSTAYGQKKIKEEYKVVFVYYENRDRNFILIPNTGKFHSVKIYRKQNTETDFNLVAEKRRPPLPMRYNTFPYEIKWEDTELHSRDIDYRILAFNKNGIELCEMVIVWEKEK